jgi:putative transposase
MNFQENQFFHVYNQGNNRRKIFYSTENFEFFKLKIGTYISPFANVIAFCLMPNHFHLLIYVKKVELPKVFFKAYIDRYRSMYFKREKIPKNGYRSQISIFKSEVITLNQAIAIMQRSYTRAINKHYKWSGSLFREGCKAKDEWEEKFQTLGDKNFYTGNLYVSKCFEYIHNNPVQAGLVEYPEEWEHSSARDYLIGNQFSICELNMGKKLIL